MLNTINEKRKVVGTKQAIRAVKSNEVELMYIAKDADKLIIKSLINLCDENNIDIIYVDTMKELGEACSIDVSAASVAILK